jgi:hypothetical protein
MMVAIRAIECGFAYAVLILPRQIYPKTGFRFWV